MAGTGKKVFVALSGGVDSSTAAALLCQEGFDCAGLFMITGDYTQHAQTDAQKIADKLRIKLYVLDLRKDFKRVLDYFCSQYSQGQTPNPCVFCNRFVKFGKLWDFAQNNGANLFATGHYARIDQAANDAGLYEAANVAKDQSYALAMINKDILPYLILPMGKYSKNQTRQMAEKLGLGTQNRQESQEICFIPNHDYISVLEKKCPELVREGNIIDSSGRVLGRHNGIHRFTIGQRRGLRVAMGKPYYVVKIDSKTNTVTLGPKQELMHKKLTATQVNWLTEKHNSAFQARVKIRYNDRGASATVTPQENGVVVEFDELVSAITPGQLAAFYVQNESGSRVIGGGWIDKMDD